MFEASKRKLLSGAKGERGAAPSDAPIGHPGGSEGLAAGAQAALFANKTEGGECAKPGKPFPRLWLEAEFAMLWRQDDRGACGGVFNEGNQFTRSSFPRMGGFLL